MSNKNTKALRNIKELQNQIAKLESERNINIGLLKAARQRLKDNGLDSVIEAEKEISRLHKEIAKKTKDLTKIEQLLDEYIEKVFPNRES